MAVAHSLAAVVFASVCNRMEALLHARAARAQRASIH